MVPVADIPFEHLVALMSGILFALLLEIPMADIRMVFGVVAAVVYKRMVPFFGAPPNDIYLISVLVARLNDKYLMGLLKSELDKHLIFRLVAPLDYTFWMLLLLT